MHGHSIRQGVLANTLTGKLSDFAGCFFLPLYLSAVLTLLTRWPLERRLGAGVLATLAPTPLVARPKAPSSNPPPTLA